MIAALSGLVLAVCGNAAMAQQAMGKIVLEINPFSTECQIN